ncbi:MAG: glycosyltransferase [Propylenella sp.]
MTVVHFNTADYQGGAGRAAHRLHNGLLQDGFSSFLLVRHQKRGFPGVFRAIERTDESGKSREGLIAAELEGVQRKLINENKADPNGTIFSFPYPGLDMIDLPLVQNAGILHLHWVNSFLSPVTIARLGQRGTPLVWTIHDEWPYSGGCHYTAGCRKYIDQDCFLCPQLAKDEVGIPSAVLRDKLELWKDLDLTIVAPSRWIGECARESRVFRGRRVEVIHNSVETEIFRPLDRELCRREFKIADSAIVLAFGAQSLSDRRKGSAVLIEALRLAMKNRRLASRAAAGGLALLTFGRSNPEMATLGIDVVHAGEVDDDATLVRFLNCANAVVVPSLEDNYPNVMVEAMACGVPVIAFDAGGISDGVKDGERGVLLSPGGSARALADAISKLVLDPAEARRYESMGAAARNWIAETHGLSAHAQRVADLYRELNPQFETPPASRVVGALKTLNRDTRKAPFKVRLIPDLGPAFETPEKGEVLRKLIAESKQSIVVDSKKATPNGKPPPEPAESPERDADPVSGQRDADLAWSVAQILGAILSRGDIWSLCRVLWRAARSRRHEGGSDETLGELGRVGRTLLADGRSMKLLTQPPPDFDERAYLSTNYDVWAAVQKGAFASGFAHYVKHGFGEYRNRPRPPSG